MMLRNAWIGLVASCCLLPFAGQAQENGLVTHKTLSPELAFDLARAATESCRAADFQVAVAVVDRFGVLQVVLRDRCARDGIDAVLERLEF